MAQGEAESFQLVVVPFWTDLENVRIEVGKIFRREGIDRFDPEQVRVWLVQSVASSGTIGAQYSPDPLMPFRSFNLPAAYSQSILITVRARSDQPPGVYDGKITVSSEEHGSIAVSLRLLVRSFAIPDDRPVVTFRAVNEALQGALSMPKSSRTVETWNRFLAPFRLHVHTASEGVIARPWLEGNVSTLMAAPAGDAYSFDAPTALAYRAAGWAAWDKRQAASGPAPWLVRGWVSVDAFESTPAGAGGAPRVRNRWPESRAGHPPGMVYLNRMGEPDPTLRLVALRDGIEDFACLDVLARLLDRATRRKAVGWWTRRRCNKLLEIDSDLVDPERIAPGDASELLERREKVAEAIENLRERLGHGLPNP
jgi:hypothetical protein